MKNIKINEGLVSRAEKNIKLILKKDINGDRHFEFSNKEKILITMGLIVAWPFMKIGELFKRK